MTGRRFRDPEVAEAFAKLPTAALPKLLRMRALIFDVAARTPGVGPLEEALRWGQPSYLTTATGAGSTIRLGLTSDAPALFFHCQSGLIERFSDLYGTSLSFIGKRAILTDGAREDMLRHCIALGLTHHLRKRRRA